jgi:hypothetical protein
MNRSASSATPTELSAGPAAHTFMYPRVSQIAPVAHTVLASSLGGRLQ